MPGTISERRIVNKWNTIGYAMRLIHVQSRPSFEERTHKSESIILRIGERREAHDISRAGNGNLRTREMTRKAYRYASHRRKREVHCVNTDGRPGASAPQLAVHLLLLIARLSLLCFEECM
ncbi:hypothetical protein Trydic_g10955 [Trypoxylus dichotomus]